MKKTNLNFNSFLLYHVEKIILLAAVVLLGLFLWWGYNTDVFNEKTPSQLRQMASQANGYIENGESWTKIAEHRKADSDSHLRIEQASKVFIGTDQYKRGRLLGTKAKTLGMRKDPILRAPIEIVAVPLYVPLLINNPDGQELAISSLPPAGQADPDEEDEEEEGNGGGPGGPGDLGDFGGRGDDDEKKKKRVDGIVLGESMPDIQAQYMTGIRPKKENLSSSQHRPEVTKIMALFGLVEIKNQWAEYDKVLQDSAAYYPDRDKPVYQYVEVQRREKGQPDDAWKDVSKRNRQIINSYFPDSVYKFGAPEVIDAKFYDPILSGKIPPISMVDYRNLATHPNGKVEQRQFPKESESSESAKDPSEGGSSLENFEIDEEDDEESEGADRDDASGKGEFEDEEDHEDQDPGDLSDQKEFRQKRKGTDRSDYIEIMNAKVASGDYKLLRFYDIGVPEGKEYEYRVRVWLADPNNENPDGLFSSLDDGEEDRDTPAAGMSQMEGGEEGPGMGQQEDESENYVYVKLESTMKDPAVRARIAKQENDLEANPKSIPNKGLRYARPTEWAYTDGAVKSAKDLGEFHAGSVDAGRQIRVNNSFSVPTGDPSAEVVAAMWNKKYHTKFPAHRIVKSGDVLDFKPEKAVHLLHPIDWSVRKLEDPPELKTGAVVVDILGGEDLRISQSKMDFKLPGEVLIMDADGNFRVQNDINDRLGYRHALFLDDELAEVGKKKKKKDDTGGFGGEGDGPGQ
ncbi:MAG: hypothetical protein MK108_16780 [Mariniblastus sp.]|nr:hypothetical protein [Mariniblastus sp.]